MYCNNYSSNCSCSISRTRAVFLFALLEVLLFVFGPALVPTAASTSCCHMGSWRSTQTPVPNCSDVPRREARRPRPHERKVAIVPAHWLAFPPLTRGGLKRRRKSHPAIVFGPVHTFGVRREQLLGISRLVGLAHEVVHHESFLGELGARVCLHLAVEWYPSRRRRRASELHRRGRTNILLRCLRAGFIQLLSQCILSHEEPVQIAAPSPFYHTLGGTVGQKCNDARIRQILRLATQMLGVALLRERRSVRRIRKNY